MLTHYTQREVTTTWVLVLATTAELEDKHHLLGSLMRDLTRKHKEHKDNAYYSIDIGTNTHTQIMANQK